MRYVADNKIYDLMCSGRVSEHGQSAVEEQVLQLMNRFGISLGVGDKTIAAICQEHQVDCDTVLAIINYALYKELPQVTIHIPTLHRYLENAHNYFLKFQLPRIRQGLLEAVNLAHDNSQIPLMIIQYFDAYAQEIKAHIDHETEHSYEQHARDDKHIANKAHELKTLIIKYYPHDTTPTNTEQMRLLYAALHDLRHFENELALHCAIEDHVMLPALRREEEEIKQEDSKRTEKANEESLSAREIEVIKYVAQGLSNKEIADVMCLSTHTVMSHRKNIARKLDIHSTAGLTIYAVVNGFVKLS